MFKNALIILYLGISRLGYNGAYFSWHGMFEGLSCTNQQPYISVYQHLHGCVQEIPVCLSVIPCLGSFYHPGSYNQWCRLSMAIPNLVFLSIFSQQEIPSIYHSFISFHSQDSNSFIPSLIIFILSLSSLLIHFESTSVFFEPTCPLEGEYNYFLVILPPHNSSSSYD